MTIDLIAPVILSGGSGTRLWPMSRRDVPKRFLPLMGDNTMLLDTALRIGVPSLFAPPLVV
ncbi:MAG: sugar phosphate nucleotidyltransferase [Alphaproteobacteria bacterium]